MQDKTHELWDAVEADKTKKSERVYNWLQKDQLASVIVDGAVYWLERTNMDSTIPNYVYDYINEVMNNKGYTYLYDMPMKY